VPQRSALRQQSAVEYNDCLRWLAVLARRHSNCLDLLQHFESGNDFAENDMFSCTLKNSK
jgi:hypothetical protein